MNYGEELAYWYLRLNGFFPLVDFVMHGGEEFKHTTDCDVLAVRPPYVFEEIGGQPHDWDGFLHDYFDGRCTVGVICQVKTGGYSKAKLFMEPHMRYAIERLGLCPDPLAASMDFQGKRFLELEGNVSLLKLFIAEDWLESEDFACLTVDHTRKFIRKRMEIYSEIKYRDRMFFQSQLLQNIIDEERKRDDVKLW